MRERSADSTSVYSTLVAIRQRTSLSPACARWRTSSGGVPSHPTDGDQERSATRFWLVVWRMTSSERAVDGPVGRPALGDAARGASKRRNLVDLAPDVANGRGVGDAPAVWRPDGPHFHLGPTGQLQRLRGIQQLDVDVEGVEARRRSRQTATILPSGDTAGLPSNPPLLVKGLMIVGASGGAGVQFHSHPGHARPTPPVTRLSAATRSAPGRARVRLAPRATAIGLLLQLFQREPHIAHRLIATVGILPEAADDDPLQFPWGTSRCPGRNRGGFVAKDCRDRRHRRLTVERPPTRDHFVQQRAEREDVRCARRPSAPPPVPATCSLRCQRSSLRAVRALRSSRLVMAPPLHAALPGRSRGP